MPSNEERPVETSLYYITSRYYDPEIGCKASNVAWLYGKLRSGYKVVDIGIDTVRAIRCSSYIAERITIGIWKSRNIWKWLYHLDF